MNFQEILSKMNPQMLAQGLDSISKNLTPEQLKQAQQAIKATNLAQNLSTSDPNQLLAELKSNPQLLSSLAKSPDLIKNLENIVKNK